jgi:predicted kinase
MVFNSGHGNNVDESIVTRIHNAALQQLMHEGRDIVVDNTNLYKSNVSYLKKLARENGYVVEFRDFIVTYEEALKRDRARPRPVGDDIVFSFFQRYTINGAGHLPKPPLN